MKSVLIITGPSNEFGTGHQLRMHALALELRRHKVTVMNLVASPGDNPELPLDYQVVLLDRRDTGFPQSVLEKKPYRIAVDNRGPGRDQAQMAYDALPHPAMDDADYRNALSAIVLPQHVTMHPCRSAEASVVIAADAGTAHQNCGFPPEGVRLSPKKFTEAMLAAEAVASYFGQTLFEACYLGKQVQLYPISPYHAVLAEDLHARIARMPGLLGHISGSGLQRLANRVLDTLKEMKIP